MGKFNISGHSAGKVFNYYFPDQQVICIHTAQTHLSIEYLIAETLSKSTGLFIGIDGSSVSGRSFIEIEFGGYHEDGVWSYLVGFLEVTDGSSDEYVKQTLQIVKHFHVIQSREPVSQESIQTRIQM